MHKSLGKKIHPLKSTIYICIKFDPLQYVPLQWPCQVSWVSSAHKMWLGLVVFSETSSRKGLSIKHLQTNLDVYISNKLHQAKFSLAKTLVKKKTNSIPTFPTHDIIAFVVGWSPQLHPAVGHSSWVAHCLCWHHLGLSFRARVFFLVPRTRGFLVQWIVGEFFAPFFPV